MSESRGPYTVTPHHANTIKEFFELSGPDVFATFSRQHDALAAMAIANLAHHHALAAQADRVRQLEEALQAVVNCGHPDKCGSCVFMAKAVLTPPAKGETHG